MRKNIPEKTDFENMLLWNTKKVQNSSVIRVTENFQLLPNYEAMLKWNIQKSPVMFVKTPLIESIWKSIVRQFMGFYRMMLSNVSFVQCFSNSRKIWKDMQKANMLEIFFQKQNSNSFSILWEKISGERPASEKIFGNPKKVWNSSAIHVTENIQLLTNYEVMLKWNMQKSSVMSVKTPLTEVIWKSIVRQFMGFYQMMPSNISFVQCFSNLRKIWKDMEEANTIEIFFISSFEKRGRYWQNVLSTDICIN